jgi:choline dehydrogenase
LKVGSNRITKAAVQHGLPFFADGVDPDIPVQACLKPNKTVDEHGYRHSTFNAYLNPSIVNARKERLKICVNSVVKKVHIHYNEQGKLRAEGVFLGYDKAAGSDEATYFVKARREVILCGGAISSPQILQLRYVPVTVIIKRSLF